jgi:hypothetical protein
MRSAGAGSRTPAESAWRAYWRAAASSAACSGGAIAAAAAGEGLAAAVVASAEGCRQLAEVGPEVIAGEARAAVIHA